MLLNSAEQTKKSTYFSYKDLFGMALLQKYIKEENNHNLILVLSSGAA